MAELMLTDRDLGILLYTWQNRFLAFRHYRRKFWGDTSIQAVQHRIYKLRDAGLLNQAELPMLDARSLFCITRKGNQKLFEADVIYESGVADFPRRPGEFKPAMLHDLQVVDLRIAFEKSAADANSWITDHHLRMARPGNSFNTRTPDGIFDFAHRDDTVKGLLEFERCSYGKELLMKVLRRLKIYYGSRTIFFVCRSAERAHTLRAWTNASRIWDDTPHQVYFSHFQAAEKDGIYCGFMSLAGTILREGQTIGQEAG